MPVYAHKPDSTVPRPISTAELVEGRFSHGAHLFVSKDGAELRRLTVQRGDLANAISILKAAGIRFRRDNPA